MLQGKGGYGTGESRGAQLYEIGETFQVPITAKRRGIEMWLLLDTNRKPYTGSPTAPLDLTYIVE